MSINGKRADKDDVIVIEYSSKKTKSGVDEAEVIRNEAPDEAKRDEAPPANPLLINTSKPKGPATYEIIKAEDSPTTGKSMLSSQVSSRPMSAFSPAIESALALSMEFLKRTEVADVVRYNRNILSVPGNTPIAKALEAMAHHRLIALPISDEGGQIVGIASMVDIARLFASVGGQLPRTREDNERQPAMVFARPIMDVLGATEESRFLVALDGSEPITKAIALFSTGNCHYAIVRTLHWTKLLAQTDLLRYIGRNRSFIAGQDGGIFTKTMGDLNAIITDRDRMLIQSTADITALQAFQTLCERKVMAMPILNESGDIIGTISCSDARGLTPTTTYRLHLPVMEYLGDNPDKAFADDDDHDVTMKRTVSCDSATTFDEVLQTVLMESVHRLWVTESGSQQFIGVVSLSDLLAVFREPLPSSPSS